MTKRILIVEDNEPIRELVRRWLIRAGYLCSEANNGKEGITLAEKFLPDLIVMDGHLPVEDGISITRRLKQSPITKHIPIVAMTIDGHLREAFISAGVDGFTVKPIRCKEFIAFIDQYLNCDSGIAVRMG